MRYDSAKNKVENVCDKYGLNIILYYPSATDDWGEETEESSITIKSFPIRYSPFDRRTAERVGFSENVDVLCYVPKELLDSYNVDLEKLDHIVVDGERYDIYKTQPYSQFGDNFLYYIIGGQKGGS